MEGLHGLEWVLCMGLWAFLGIWRGLAGGPIGYPNCPLLMAYFCQFDPTNFILAFCWFQWYVYLVNLSWFRPSSGAYNIVVHYCMVASYHVIS